MKKLFALTLIVSSLSAFAQQPNIAGTWKLDSDASTKLLLNKDGSFQFLAPAYKSSSSGAYEVRDGSLWLTYKEVDGEPLRVSSPMRVTLSADGSSFKINRFRYVRG